MSVPFRVGSAFDLLRIIPVVLDFMPEDAVVTVAIREGRLALAARLDLNLPATIAEAQAAHVADTIIRNGADTVMLVRYCTTTDDKARIGDSIALHLLGDHVPVLLNVTVRGCQFSATAVYTVNDDPTVHAAPALTDLPADLGRTPGRRRDDVARTIDPGPRAATISALVAARRDAGTPVDRHAAGALWARVLSQPVATLTDEDVADAVHALTDPHVHDRVMLATPDTNHDPATVVGMRSRMVADATRVERLTELSACLTDDEAAPVLGCLAVTAYASGLGALFNMTEDRLARTPQPRHSLTVLALEFAHAGFDPATVLP